MHLAFSTWIKPYLGRIVARRPDEHGADRMESQKLVGFERMESQRLVGFERMASQRLVGFDRMESQRLVGVERTARWSRRSRSVLWE
jgi:hypothetical protein